MTRTIDNLVIDALTDQWIVENLQPIPPRTPGAGMHASTLFADCPARALIEDQDPSRYFAFDEGVRVLGLHYEQLATAGLARWYYNDVREQVTVPWEFGTAHIDGTAADITDAGHENELPLACMLEVKSSSSDERKKAPSRAVAQAQGYQWLAHRADVPLPEHTVALVVDKVTARTSWYPVPAYTPAFASECERRVTTLVALAERIATLDFWLDEQLRAFCKCSSCFYEPPEDATADVHALVAELAPDGFGRVPAKGRADEIRAELKRLVPAGHRGYRGDTTSHTYTVAVSRAGALSVRIRPRVMEVAV